jgi:hypothetical protein
MKTSRISFATALASACLALASAASAHGPWSESGSARGLGPAMGAMGTMSPPERAAARSKTLEAELRLQPTQTAAFAAYAAKIQTEAEARAKVREAMMSRRGDPQAMSEFRVTIAKHNAEALDELNQLRKNLVAVLTPEQKQVLDRHGFGHGAGSRLGGMAWGRGCAARAG